MTMLVNANLFTSPNQEEAPGLITFYNTIIVHPLELNWIVFESIPIVHVLRNFLHNGTIAASRRAPMLVGSFVT